MIDARFRDVFDAVRILDGYHLPRAVRGGRTIDLVLKRITRPYKDLDFVKDLQ